MRIKRMRLKTSILQAGEIIGSCEAEIVMPDGVQFKSPYYFMQLKDARGNILIAPQTEYIETISQPKALVIECAAKVLNVKLQSIRFESQWKVVEVF